MAKLVELDASAPLRSLREALGLQGRELAELRGIAPSSQSEAESIGTRISLEKLLSAAEKAGVKLRILLEFEESDDLP